jgi:insulysin
VAFGLLIISQQAISWLDHIERSLPSRALSPSEWAVPRSLLIPPGDSIPRIFLSYMTSITGCNYVFRSLVPNTTETNSGISYLCCAGAISNSQIRSTASLLASMMNESFFNIMRTKEQLGYSVQCGTWAETATIGLRFQIQSFRHPDFLEARIDAFIHSYLDTLRTMPLDEFKEHKRGAAARKREKLMNMSEERDRFWTHIVNGYHEFERGIFLKSFDIRYCG